MQTGVTGIKKIPVLPVRIANNPTGCRAKERICARLKKQ